MSIDIFGNSPAMSPDEIATLLAPRWTIVLDICDPDGIDEQAAAAGVSVTYISDGSNSDAGASWPELRFSGTFYRLAEFLRDVYAEDEPESFLYEFGREAR